MMQRLVCFVSVLFLLFIALFKAEAKGKIKFGQVSMEEITMKQYDKDPDAEAVVLFDKGYSYIRYDVSEGRFRLYFDHHKRVKIFKKAGYDYATEAVRIFHINGAKENIIGLKGFTYNLVDGKIEKVKMNSESVFEEKVSDYWNAKKFTMPNVKEGSIIEFTYTIKSDFWSNMRDWEFQTSIPTLYSEYSVKHYEYFDYKKQSQGYEPIESAPVEEVNDDIVFGMNRLSARAYLYKWSSTHMPALKEEPFITTVDNYVTKIFFDLSTVKLPGEILKNYASSWGAIAKNLLESENFGEQLNKKGFIKKEVAAISAKHTDPTKKAEAIYSFVKDRMKWNEYNMIYCTSSIKKAYEEKTGTTADINLLLIAMLREANIQADPVILSTRENGHILQVFAQLSRFNYVIARVVIDGKEYLLDATEKHGSMNMLPFRCLNGEGLLLTNAGAKWIPLSTGDKISQMYFIQLNIDKEGLYAGKIQNSSSGYYAFNKRKQIIKEGQEEYVKNLKKESHNWDIDKFEIKNLEILQEPLNQSYEIKSTESILSGNMLYINPVFFDRETENPFKLEERRYPVDFGLPIDKTYICNLVMPDGFQIEELPKNAIVEMPEKRGKFIYSIKTAGNTINITTKFQLNKPVYYTDDYANLKEFYNLVVAKHAEQIVLKKIQ